MSQRSIGLLLATAQFFLCAGLIWIGRHGFSERPWLWSGVLAGGLIAASGVWAMRVSQVKITPEPGPNAELCERGIYARIRHPMYAGLLLACAMFAIGAGNWQGWTIWAALLAVLLSKIRIEERLWSVRDPAYRDYTKRSKRLVPWIW